MQLLDKFFCVCEWGCVYGYFVSRMLQERSSVTTSVSGKYTSRSALDRLLEPDNDSVTFRDTEEIFEGLSVDTGSINRDLLPLC